MIASVKGRISAVSTDGAVIEIGGDSGIGLAVQCTSATLAQLSLGQIARLSTSLVVREDSLTLYGFADDAAKTFFELLQTASGVGPRLAQAALGVHSPQLLRRAILSEDIAALTAVPGIGKKGAQRLVLELRERMAAVVLAEDATTAAEDAKAAATIDQYANGAKAEPLWREQVREGLLTLGWSAKLAEDATARAAQQWHVRHSAASDDSPAASNDSSPDVAELLKAAIAIVGRGR